MTRRPPYQGGQANPLPSAKNTPNWVLVYAGRYKSPHWRPMPNEAPEIAHEFGKSSVRGGDRDPINHSMASHRKHPAGRNEMLHCSKCHLPAIIAGKIRGRLGNATRGIGRRERNRFSSIVRIPSRTTPAIDRCRFRRGAANPVMDFAAANAQAAWRRSMPAPADPLFPDRTSPRLRVTTFHWRQDGSGRFGLNMRCRLGSSRAFLPSESRRTLFAYRAWRKNHHGILSRRQDRAGNHMVHRDGMLHSMSGDGQSASPESRAEDIDAA